MSAPRAWKPTGYSSCSQYLVVTGAQRVIEFAKAAFGAIELRRYEEPDGTIMHAEFRIDDSVIMLGDAGAQMTPIPALLHVYVEDVDHTFALALKAGATPVEEPHTRPGDPDKRGSVKDSCGNTWSIATQL